MVERARSERFPEGAVLRSLSIRLARIFLKENTLTVDTDMYKVNNIQIQFIKLLLISRPWDNISALRFSLLNRITENAVEITFFHLTTT